MPLFAWQLVYLAMQPIITKVGGKYGSPVRHEHFLCDGGSLPRLHFREQPEFLIESLIGGDHTMIDVNKPK